MKLERIAQQSSSEPMMTTTKKKPAGLYQIDILVGMHIISLKMLREFWEKHPEAEQVLKDWHSVLEKSTAKDFNALKNTFNSADYVPPYTVFDVGGNNYRVIVVVQYKFKKVYVCEVMTHREYDNWNKLYRKGKV